MFEKMAMYRHILVPLDGSELAETALPTAFQMAEGTSARLTLLRVLEPLPITIQPAAYHKLTQSAEQEAKEYLDALAGRLPETAVSINFKLLRGGAAEAILEFAQTHDVDLIIMSSHGRSGISRWYHGSIAESVLRGAVCNTLVVHQQTAA